MNYLGKAINKFNIRKKQLHLGAKYTVPYGKWNDTWNIDGVLVDALKFYTIDKIFNIKQYGNKSSYDSRCY